MIVEEKAEAQKNQLAAASFTAWQVCRWHGEKRDWPQYARDMGLIEKETISKEERREIAKRAYSRADQIRAMDKRRKK